MTDELLLTEYARTGRPELFEEMAIRFRPMIVSMASRLVDGNTAQDIAQEVLLKIFLRCGTYRCGSRAKTWIMRIAINEAISWMRRPYERKKKPIPVDDLLAGGFFHAHGKKPRSCNQAAVAAEVDRLVAQLPKHHRMVVILHDLCDATEAEVARRLGIAQGTVKSRRHRALNMMRQMPVDAQVLVEN